MDGPNINWKFLELLAESRVEAEIPSLINIGSCGIHVMHGAFKTGAKASGWGVSKIMKALARLFLDSPARWADYVEMTGTSLFPMSFCTTRWIEDEPVAQRAIQIWDHVGKIVKYWSKLPKPSAKCYSTIKDAVDDKLTVAKFHFFASVATQLRPFLESYLTDPPMVSFLYDELEKLMRTIFSWFIKPELLENAETGFQLTKIDVCKRDNHVLIKSVNIGFAAQQFLQEKLKKDIITDSDVLAFKKNSILFLSEMVAKIIERSPLKSFFVRCTSFLVPQNMVLNKDLVKLRFKKLLQKLLDLKQVTSKQCDNAQAQLLEFMDSVKVNQAEFESYDRTLYRLDNFTFSKIGVEKFLDFCLVIK